MTNKIIKTLYITLLGTFMVLGFLAQTSFSDSFVDKALIQTLENYKLGEPAPSVDTQDQTAAEATYLYVGKGDSFVDASTIEALNDFRFGQFDNSDSMDSAIFAEEGYSPMNHGDSFVDAEVIRQSEHYQGEACIAYCN